MLASRIQKLKDATEKLMQQDALPMLSFSEGNTKTDKLVPSISLRPILDCSNCKHCANSCYDIRNDIRYQVHYNSRAKNYVVWKKNPNIYFDLISAYCKNKQAFRWHIGGDIQNYNYLNGVVKVTKENRHCRFLIFTKMFALCNVYFEKHRKPSNLQIIYSAWIGQDMPNPHNFPTSHLLYADGTTSASDGARLCTGNCSECLTTNKGCWSLKKGQQVVFMAH